MNRRNASFWVVLIAAVLSLSGIIYINFETIIDFVSRAVSTYGYAGIFILVYIVDLFEWPINPEIIASIGVVLGLNVLFIFLFAAVADFLGLLTSFYVGRKYMAEKIMTSCSTKKKYQKYCGFFYKYGRVALLVAMVTPVPNIIFVWLAGAFKLKIRDFIFFGSIPSLLRIGFILLIVSGIISIV